MRYNSTKNPKKSGRLQSIITRPWHCPNPNQLCLPTGSRKEQQVTLWFAFKYNTLNQSNLVSRKFVTNKMGPVRYHWGPLFNFGSRFYASISCWHLHTGRDLVSLDHAKKRSWGYVNGCFCYSNRARQFFQCSDGTKSWDKNVFP